MWFVVLFLGGFFVPAILGSQIACFDMIPFSTSSYQDVDLPYEVKKLKKYHIQTFLRITLLSIFAQ